MKKTVVGFTLIELMVAVAIISILAAVAIPAYTQFIKKSRRSDAKIALMVLAQAQATHYTDFRRYADKIGNPASSDTIRCKTFCSETKSGGRGLSPDKHYVLSIGLSNGGYTLTATAEGAQADNDPDCKTLTLTSSNIRGSTGDGDVEECWGKN